MFISSLLLQPVACNAINHGLLPPAHGGNSGILFRRDTERHHIICEIDDNGTGKTRAKKLNGKPLFKASYGNGLISAFAGLVSKHNKHGISITYVNKVRPYNGTKVIITIKNPIYGTPLQQHHSR